MCRFPSQLHEGTNTARGQYLGLSKSVFNYGAPSIGQSPLTLTLESGVRFLHSRFLAVTAGSLLGVGSSIHSHQSITSQSMVASILSAFSIPYLAVSTAAKQWSGGPWPSWGRLPPVDNGKQAFSTTLSPPGRDHIAVAPPLSPTQTTDAARMKRWGRWGPFPLQVYPEAPLSSHQKQKVNRATTAIALQLHCKTLRSRFRT
jgi:hypothetical protein